MKRRDFLTLSGLVLGSVLIPASVARLIRETCVDQEKPLLILPRSIRGTIYAVKESSYYTLHLGDPDAEPEPPTWSEWFYDRDVDAHDPEEVAKWFRENEGHETGEEPTIDPDETIDGGALATWMDWDYELQASSTATAYHYLNALPLCPGRRVEGSDPLGSLSFIEGDRPGSNFTYVEAPDLSTLACLQHRLNELGERTAIEIRES